MTEKPHMALHVEKRSVAFPNGGEHIISTFTGHATQCSVDARTHQIQLVSGSIPAESKRFFDV